MLVADIEAIVERCREGDPLAWETLVRRHQARVYSVAYHYLRDSEEARDLAQDVFVRVYEKLDTFTGGAFLPWLLRLARNCAVDRLRRKKARPPSSDVSADAGANLADGRRGPEEEWLADARKRLVHAALGRLSEQNREVILLKEIQGLQIQEIAEVLGVPVGTVKSRSNRARIALARKVLELDPSYGVP
jgi:RNA polymerase sigma-70 factor (ECF subfamily)